MSILILRISAPNLICLLALVLTSFSSLGNCNERLGARNSEQTSALFLPNGKVNRVRLTGTNSFFTTQRLVDRGLIVEWVHAHQFLESSPRIESLPALDKSEVDGFLKDISEVVGRLYPRRKWEESFISKVSSVTKLKKHFPMASHILVRDPLTNTAVGSSRLLVAPYFIDPEPQRIGDTDYLGASISSLPVEKDFIKESLPRRRLAPELGEWAGPYQGKSLQALFEVSSLTADLGSQGKLIRGLLYKYFLYLSMLPAYSINGHNHRFLPGSLLSQLVSNPYEEFVYAYGDRIGKLMYTPYGFTAEKNFGTKVLMSTNWHLLAAGQGLVSGVRERYDLGELTGEACSLYRQNTDQFFSPPSLIEHYNPVLAATHCSEEEVQSYRRLNTILGGPSPQQINHWKSLPGGPRTYWLDSDDN